MIVETMIGVFAVGGVGYTLWNYFNNGGNESDPGTEYDENQEKEMYDSNRIILEELEEKKSCIIPDYERTQILTHPTKYRPKRQNVRLPSGSN